MQDSELYQQILGLRAPWSVVNVRMVLEEEEIIVEISHPPGTRFCCPECQREIGFASVLCMTGAAQEEIEMARPGGDRSNPKGSGYPKGAPSNRDPNSGFPHRNPSGLPIDGVDGWFCPMDQTLSGKRGWPDWECAPIGKTPPFEKPRRLN